MPSQEQAEANTNETPTISKRQQWREGTIVTLTEKGTGNPKKPGSESFNRYAILLSFKRRLVANAKEPVTVAELMKAGYRMDDYRHDLSHGFIASTEPFALGAQG